MAVSCFILCSMDINMQAVYTCVSRLTVGSRMAKKSRISMLAIIKHNYREDIYTHNNGACKDPTKTQPYCVNIP